MPCLKFKASWKKHLLMLITILEQRKKGSIDTIAYIIDTFAKEYGWSIETMKML